MNIKRAVFSGALLWVLIFFEVSILMFGFKIRVPALFYYSIHIPLMAILVVIASIFYFKKASESGIKAGLFLGISFLIISVILDSIITIPLFVKDYSFFLRKDILMGFLEVLIVTSFVGWIKK